MVLLVGSISGTIVKWLAASSEMVNYCRKKGDGSGKNLYEI